MLPKKNSRQFWRNLIINAVVILICGTIAITLPILLNSSNSDAASELDTDLDNPQATLQCINVDEEYRDTSDYPHIWQLRLVLNDDIIITWNEIYTTHTNQSSQLTVTGPLAITPSGIVYKGNPADYATFLGLATYRGRTAVIRATL